MKKQSDRKVGMMMGIVAAVFALGIIVVYGLLMPPIAVICREMLPELEWFFWPCVAYCCSTAVPCIAALIAFIRLIVLVQTDRSFSRESEKSVRLIGWMAMCEAALLVIGVFIQASLEVGAPVLVILFFMLIVIALLVGLLALALARLIHRASLLREENDLTV